MKMEGRRVWMSLGGVVTCAVAVAFFREAAFGVDPFQSLMSGLDRLIPISFGTLYMIVNGILLVFSLVFNRRKIGIATFINLFLLGYITQFAQEGLQRVVPEPGMALRIGYLAVGVVVLCIGSALYMTADLGVSTYDAIAITMAEKWKWGPFKYIRIATDVVCVLLGILCFLLGGGTWGGVPAIVGVGTIITAFFMGPLIEFFNERIARPLLRKGRAPEAAPAAGYDHDLLEPVIRCSICTGEQTAGFREKESGKFRDVALLRSEADLEAFRRQYGIEGEIRRIY